MEEFEIPAEDFEAIKQLLRIGQPAVAAAKFQQCSGASADEAALFIEQLLEAEPDLAPPADPEPAAPPPPTFEPPATPAAGEDRLSHGVHPGISRESETRKKSWRDVPDDPEIRWYHHILECLSLPLVVIGGLVGVFCFAVGYLVSFKVFRFRLPAALQYGLSIAGTAAAFALYGGIASKLAKENDESPFVRWWKTEIAWVSDLTKDKEGNTGSGLAEESPVENVPTPEIEAKLSEAITDLRFSAEDGSLPILKAAAEAIGFELTEQARERHYFSPKTDLEFETTTPTELVERFEKITGRRVVFDYNAKTIDVE